MPSDKKSFAQESPSLPSSLLGGSAGSSLADMLRADLMKRLQETANPKESSKTQRPGRPRPELGRRSDVAEPIDLSKYIGPAGDSQKTYDKLREMGKIPPPTETPSAKGATHTAPDIWKDMPPEKRLAYADDLLKRRKFESAKEEIEKALDQGLQGKDLQNALLIREKALFNLHYNDVVENDYFRLKNLYPKEKKIDELKNYLEKESGIAPLKEAVLKNPSDPAAQRKLLDRYAQLGWLDFAEEFFAETVHSTSEATVQSLSEVFYRKGDFPMLIQLSRAGQKLYPSKADYVYNEGVGLFSAGDPTSLEEAKTVFQKAQSLAPTPVMRGKVDWYLQRLANQKKP